MATSKTNVISIGSGQLSDLSTTTRIFSSNSRCDAYAALTNYSIGNVVEYSGTLYRSLQNSNIGYQPDVSPTYWVAEFQNVHDGDIHISVSSGTSDIQQRISGLWLSLGGQPLKVSLVDGQLVSAPVFAYSAGIMPYAEINYTIRRGPGHGQKRRGKVIILNDLTGSLQYSHEFDEIGADVEVPLTFAIGGGFVTISYTSVLQGSVIEFAYDIKGWA
jgi:hypothetical protein